uniref:CHCH domain-containing protein n=1 Tax=Peronospora matthiolae TaxID=2874970 RepID=A0AAV1TNS6_9STRA
MPPKECLTCKPGNDTHHQSAVEKTGCEDSYMRVDACMKRHNGRVSACTKEWEKFRQCHEQNKAAHKSGDKK